YQWDFEGRLTGAATPGGILNFAYDVDGIRVAKTSTGATTRYIVDKNRQYAQVLEERGLANFLKVRYALGDDLISQDRGGSGERFYHFDGQMSTRQLSDANGQVTDTYVYDAYGVMTGSTGSTVNQFLYSGEQFDEDLGFYYHRARYRNQSTDRFI